MGRDRRGGLWDRRKPIRWEGKVKRDCGIEESLKGGKGK